jgi:hypothetical protein
VHVEGVAHLGGADDDMDVEDVHDTRRDSMDDVVVIGDDELENMIDEQDRAEVIEKLVPAEELRSLRSTSGLMSHPTTLSSISVRWTRCAGGSTQKTKNTMPQCAQNTLMRFSSI